MMTAYPQTPGRATELLQSHNKPASESEAQTVPGAAPPPNPPTPPVQTALGAEEPEEDPADDGPTLTEYLSADRIPLAALPDEEIVRLAEHWGIDVYGEPGGDVPTREELITALAARGIDSIHKD